MSYARRLTVAVTTIADGSAMVYSDPIDYGLLSQIRYVKPGSGGFDDGSTITITAEATGETLWAEAAVNASTTRAPRAPLHSTVGVALGATLVDKIAIVNDRIKIVIASGGNVKAASFIFVLG